MDMSVQSEYHDMYSINPSIYLNYLWPLFTNYTFVYHTALWSYHI